MSEKQLNLLTWKPSVQVIPFPLSRDMKRVRRTAQVLSGKTGKDAEAYWFRITNHLSQRLIKAGVEQSIVESEIITFTNAVGAALARYD